MSSHVPHHADRMRHFERRCRELGLALTVQRRVVLEVVLARRDHPTADQIFDDVKTKFPDISRTTVYRVLDTLVDIGVIGKPSHFGSATRFEPNIHHHHHLICTRCGKVWDVENDGPQLDIANILKGSGVGFDVSNYSIHVNGTCADCRGQSPVNRSDPDKVS